MNFMEEVATLDTRPSANCKVDIFLKEQDEKELQKSGRDVVTDEALRSIKEKHTLKAVHSALKLRGFTGSDESLNKHLKKECVCYMPRG